jgi:hypothetical protein
MKNKIYIIGLLSSLLIIAGGILKISHIAGASITLIAGIFTLCIMFLPAAVISSYNDSGKRKPLLYIAVFFTVFADFIGALFKIMHWPGASILMAIGIVAPIVVFLPVYLFYHYNEEEASQTNFLYIMFLLVYLSGMSAMLSVNVSKDILTDVIRYEKISNLNDYYQLKKEIGSHDEKIAEVKGKTAELLNYINSVKVRLVVYNNKENKAAVNENGMVNTFKITNYDSRDATGIIMFGQKEALSVKKRLEDYREYLTDLSNTCELKNELIALELLNTNDIGRAEEQQLSWEQHYFGDLPLIFILQKLTEIENNIIMAETEIITNIGQKAAV